LTKLSDSARALLTVAATRDDHLVPLPRLPVAAARQVVRSLLKAGLAEEVSAPTNDAAFAWRTREDGRVLRLQAIALGLTHASGPDNNVTDKPSTSTETGIAPEIFRRTEEASGGATAAVSEGGEIRPVEAPLADMSGHSGITKTGEGEAATALGQGPDTPPVRPTRSGRQDALR
jgi:hypothetical protein